MDFEISISDLFAYVGKLYIELEEAKKKLAQKDLELFQLNSQLSSQHESVGEKSEGAE